MSKFKFLSEKPERDKLEFGHGQILKALKDIVATCPTPFTIGLFGKWGSGKSSISESLQKSLLVKDIPVVIFDVWKHEGDALRRTFLKEIVRQLRKAPYGRNFFDTNFQLSARIEGDVQQKLPSKLNKKNLVRQALWFVLLPAAFILLLYFALNQYTPEFTKWLKTSWSGLISLTAIGGIIQFLYTYLKDISTASEILITENRITDPHDFEAEFAKVLGATKNPRIVIVFDNLDRVSGESALSIISTIKTFLEPVDRSLSDKDVIFLIPCDVTAIKSHISTAMHSDRKTIDPETYSDEFLRKFFNTIVWIPDFYEVELEGFAKAKLTQTEIKEFNDPLLAWLIIQVFSQNPRQIIQFINVLISNYLVIKETAEIDGFVDKSFHTKNVPQLAKYLLLVQRFPEIMDHNRSSRTFDLMEAGFPSGLDEKNKADFIRFRANTAGIKIDSLEPFFNFRISRYEQQVPGISKLFQLMDNDQIEDAIAGAKQLNIGERVDDFSGAIQNYLKPKVNGVIIGNFLNTLFAITAELQITLTPSSYMTIQAGLREYGIMHAERIKPSRLVDQFVKKELGITVNDSLITDVVSRWIDILRSKHVNKTPFLLSEDYELDMMAQLQVLHNHIKKDLEELIQLSSVPYAKELKMPEILVNSSVQEKFVGSAFADEFLKSITVENIKDLPARIELLKKIRQGTLEKINIQAILEKLTYLVQQAGVLPDLEVKESLINAASEIIGCFLKQLNIDKESPVSTGFVNALQASYEQNRYSGIHFLIPFVNRLKGFPNVYYVGAVNRWEKDFASNLMHISQQNISYALDRIAKPAEFLDRVIDHLQAVVRTSPDHFKVLYKYASANARLDWLILWINEARFEWLTTLEETIFSSGIPDRLSVFNNTITRLSQHDNPRDWGFASDFLEKFKDSEFKPGTSEFITLLIKKLQHPDPTMQKAALEWFTKSVYLSSEDKKSVALPLVHTTLETTEPTQEILHTAIVYGFENLPVGDKLNYANHLFSDVIVQTADESQVALATNQILQLKIDLTDYKDKLNMILSKAVHHTTTNPALSKSLFESLFKLTEAKQDSEIKKFHKTAKEALEKEV